MVLAAKEGADANSQQLRKYIICLDVNDREGIRKAGYATGGHQEEPRCGKEGADVLFEAFNAGLLVRCL